MTYNMALNGYYNPLTANALANSFGTNALSQAYTNTSSIYDYSNNAMMNSIANNAGTNGALNNFDPYASNAGLCGGLGMGMMGGCYPGMYGMGMYGWGPGSEVMNMSQSDLLRYQENLQNQTIDMQTRQRNKLNAADYQASAGEKAVKERIEVLHNEIVNNNQDNVMGAYGQLKEAVQKQLKLGGYLRSNSTQDEELVKSYMNDLYERVVGRGIAQDLRASGDGYTVQGIKQGLFGFGIWGGANKKNRGDNISDITGQPVTKSDKGWKLTGQIVGGAITFVAGCLLFKNGGKVISAVGKGIGKFLFH